MTDNTHEQEMALVVEHWLRYNEECHQRDGNTVTDITHVIPPVWPTRGQLKAWLSALRSQTPAEGKAGERPDAAIEQL